MHDKTPERRHAARGEPGDRNTGPSGEKPSTVDTRSTQGPLHVAVEAVAFRMQDTMPGAAVALLHVAQAAGGATAAPVVMSGLPEDARDALRAVDGSALLSCLPAPSRSGPAAQDASCFPGPHGAVPAGLDDAMRRGGYRSACLAPVLAGDGRVAAVLLALTKTPPAAEVPARLADGARLCGAALDHAPGADAGALLRPVMDASLDALVLFDPAEGAILLVNRAFTTLLGYGPDQAARMPVAQLFAPDGNRSPPAVDASAGDGARSFERRWLRRQDGSMFPADCATTAFAADGGRLACLAMRDVTDRFRTERTLSLAARVFDAMGEGVVISGPDNRMLSVNGALKAMTGYDEAELVGKDAGFLCDDQTQWREILGQFSAGQKHYETEVLLRRKNGQIFPCLLSLSHAGQPAGDAPGLVAIYRDITLRRRNENHLRFLANHDLLTRLPNRMQFYRRLDHAIGEAARSERAFAVLFIDLDRFKNINDTFGHSAGDLLLQMVSDRLSRNVRKSDLLARLGGDEFTVLAECLPDTHDVVALTDHIMEALAQPFHIEGHELFVSASIGIAVFPQDGRDAESLIRSADAAMYHAKGLGKNNYQFFIPDMSTRALEQLVLESALRHAIERGEFMLYYQPKVQASTEHIFGMEALLRWNHPTLGVILPSRFIPLAEETGLIREIGRWALREACRQNAIWRRAGYPSLVVSVNLSSVQLISPDFADVVADILRETELPHDCLELEITESVIMESPEQSTRTLQALRDMGVKISIDDFGTGYSSLNYLKRFPIGTLKIDQSFVRDINTDPNDAAITDAVISLARSLKMDVIAEGVETPEQLRYLQRNGCDAYQGFLFSRPLPSAEFQQLLTAQPN